MSMIYSFNFHLYSEQTTDIETLNRGLLYGDGFFETMKLVDGNIPLLPFHYQRIQKAHQAFGMHAEFSLDFLADHLQKLCEENQLIDGRVKIIFWRKSGGFYAATSNTADIYIQVGKNTALPDAKKQAVVYKEIKNSFSAISIFKTLSAAKYVLAANFMQSKNADDVILLDESNHVSELLYSNIFWIKNNKLYTPSLNTGCIEGTMRSFILDNFKGKEGEFSLNDLKSSEFCFSTNALGIIPIKKVEDYSFEQTSTLFNNISQKLPF